ncbi:MAG: hypothetical protein HY208_00300 [Nitrospirae bacterium]|nr:hypothetical protein [Nitrospirota bacterium]
MGVALLTRTELGDSPHELLRAGRYWQPDLFLVSRQGRRYVVKDYRARPPMYRWTAGILSTWREAKNYRRLAGLPGIPAFGGRIDRYALAVEFIPGRNADRFQKGELSPAFFSELRTIIQGVHDRGVVLGDLRNSKNIMVTEQGRPVLIDFSTGFGRGGWWNPLQRWLYRIFEQDDFLGVAKLKRRYAPELMTEEERRGLEEGLPLEGPAHALRDGFKAVVKRVVGAGQQGKKRIKG